MNRYIVDTKNIGLKLEPKRNANKLWEIVYFSDNNCVRDPVSSRNMSSCILYILGVLVFWQSKSLKNVTLSNSEAELAALSERSDVCDYIFMAGYITIMSHTKHMDIRYTGVNECVKDGVVTISIMKMTTTSSQKT